MKSKSSNRSFGLLFFVVFLILGLWPLKNFGDLNLNFLIISGVFLALGLFDSKLLTPLNKAWVKFGEILGMIIAPIIMGIVFFFLVTPISLLVRIFGKDLLSLRMSKKIKSYWRNRSKDLGKMNKQF